MAVIIAILWIKIYGDHRERWLLGWSWQERRLIRHSEWEVLTENVWTEWRIQAAGRNRVVTELTRRVTRRVPAG